jgi:transposase InsO family protein
MRTVLPGGKVAIRRHPIAFASKRTSPAEERYQPHLLEFAALKFSLDKFSNIIWGQPVKLETDCQALRDIMVNDKLNVTHTRWRDGIMGYQIVGAEHVKGANNTVADALSRADEGAPKVYGDGSEWTVSPDWEARSGIVNDLFTVSIEEATYLVMPVPEGTAALRERFKEELMYLQVIDALTELDFGADERERKRARHRASQYFIEEGKLWRLGGGAGVRARPRRECITRAEARAKAVEVHAERGHFHRDSIKLALMDKFHSPRMDESILKAIADCAKCKGFGPAHLHSLLDPVIRRHPFELCVGDYLSMPVGVGGYSNVGLYLDTCSQHVWGFMYKVSGSADTTTAALDTIFGDFLPSEVFMADQGRHFKNKKVQEFCDKWGTKFHSVAAYSPWINGLVEGTNKLLLYILARLCAPDVGEDGWRSMTKDDLPKQWPKHFPTAIRILNSRILPSIKFTPKEILFGMPVNTKATPVADAVRPFTVEDAAIHMVYAEQQRLDGYAGRVEYAIGRKAAFDRKVLGSRAGEVIFDVGQLVQVFRSDLTHTMSNERKLTVKWSEPHRVRQRLLNSYILETVEGILMDGPFSSRRLRAYIAREGTPLALAQAEFMAKIRGEAGERAEAARKLREAELAEVERIRAEEVGAGLDG